MVNIRSYILIYVMNYMQVSLGIGDNEQKLLCSCQFRRINENDQTLSELLKSQSTMQVPCVTLIGLTDDIEARFPQKFGRR